MGALTPLGTAHVLGACGGVTSMTLTSDLCLGMVCRMRRIVPSSFASSAIIVEGM